MLALKTVVKHLFSAKIIDTFKSLTIFAKSFILDVSQSLEFASNGPTHGADVLSKKQNLMTSFYG